MKRRVAMALALILAACQGNAPGPTGDLRAVEQERDHYRAELEKERAVTAAQQQYMAETTRVLNEVQDSVAQIRRSELQIVRVAAAAGQEGWVQETQRRQVLRDIASLREALRNNQAKLARLEEQAAGATAQNADLTAQIAGLSSLVSRLQKTITEQDQDIAALQKTIEDLRDEIRRKDEVIRGQDETIVQQGAQIEEYQTDARTGYVLVGEGDELKRLGVVQVRRGPLGVRRHWQLARDLDSTLFRPVDIEQTREISLAAPLKKVEILSSHPSSSYSLEGRGANSTLLRILDPKGFWQFRFLVVLRKP